MQAFRMLSVAFFVVGASAFVPNVGLHYRGGTSQWDSLSAHSRTPLRSMRQMPGITTLNMASPMDNPKNNDHSGEEGGGNPQEGNPPKANDSAQGEAALPSAVSAMQLEYLACQLRLKEAVEDQDFKEAAQIKQTMNELESKQIEGMVGKLLDDSKQMRETEQRSKNKDSLRVELQQAVDEEDYELAQRIQERIAEANERVKNLGNRLPLLKRIDMVWIESEIGSRILQARAKEDELLKDPIFRLQSSLGRALDEELYEEAASIRDSLRREEHERDFCKMQRDLGRIMTYKNAELERMKRNKVSYLNYQFQTALLAEDYEAAGQLAKDLAAAEVERMYVSIRKGVKLATEKKARADKTTQLDAELDQSIAEEVIDTVVVALCLVATVGPAFIFVTESVELALSLMN